MKIKCNNTPRHSLDKLGRQRGQRRLGSKEGHDTWTVSYE